MSLELVNTFVTLGTFLVIAATAIAAMVQLRHSRGSNQIAALNELRVAHETPEFQAAIHFVGVILPTKMLDPAFRYQLTERSARTDETRSFIAKIHLIADYYERIGVLENAGLVDAELVNTLWAPNVVATWERLSSVIAIRRRREGDVLWENFECAAVRAQEWSAAHPKGVYPAGVRRIELNDEWLDADRQYAALQTPHNT